MHFPTENKLFHEFLRFLYLAYLRSISLIFCKFLRASLIFILSLGNSSEHIKPIVNMEMKYSCTLSLQSHFDKLMKATSIEIFICGLLSCEDFQQKDSETKHIAFSWYLASHPIVCNIHNSIVDFQRRWYTIHTYICAC